MRIGKSEHGPENAAIEAAKWSCAENLCNIRVNILLDDFDKMPPCFLDDNSEGLAVLLCVFVVHLF